MALNVRQKMNTIARFQLPEEAYLFRSYLESHEIESHVFDEHLVQLAWHYSNAIGGVRVAVSDSYSEEASKHFAEYSKALRQSPTNRSEVRAWPLTLLISLLIGVPVLVFGRKKL